jgi:hypothetical protein
MNPPRRFGRRREIFLALLLAVCFGCSIVLYFLMISNRLFWAILAVSAAMIVLCGLQYLLWGRPLSRDSTGNNLPPRAPRQPD